MNRILLAALAVLCMSGAYAQAKKPILMVVPADVWMNKNGFAKEVDVQGTKKLEMDYERALQTDADLNLAISKLGELMTDRGFDLQRLDQAIKKYHEEEAEGVLRDNNESSLDKLLGTVKCDIIMSLEYTVTDGMKGRQLTFVLNGLDAYTSKQIASASGTSQPANAIPAELLAEAVGAHLDKFNVQLQAHFDELFANGREITIKVKSASASGVSMDDEFEGEELADQIANWVRANSVKNRFGSPTGDEVLTIGQIRIPMYGEDGNAIDARDWAKGLAKRLQDLTKQPVKRLRKGLGTCTLEIGGK